jgi:hypothetical protein
MLDLLIGLIIVVLIVWIIQLVLAQFSLPPPVHTILLLMVVLLCVLALAKQLRYV